MIARSVGARERPKNGFGNCCSAPRPNPLPGVPGRGSHCSVVPGGFHRVNRRLPGTAVACFAWSCAAVLLAAEMPRVDPADVGLSRDKLTELRPALQQLVDNQKLPGAVVWVARRGQVAWVEAVGRQNVKADQAMREDTIFRIYSMSKPITSVAALLLVEDGKLKLDAPVADLYPPFAGLQVYTGQGDSGPQTRPPQRPMTVRDLLRHTSGLTYGFFGLTAVDRMYREARVLDQRDDLPQLAERLAKLPLLADPGTKFNYSVSTDVLGFLVELASGQPLDEFLRKRIWEPLDMRDTGFWVPDEKLDRFAANYSPQLLGGLREIDDPQTSAYRHRPRLLSGGGGLVSTARDYGRFAQMLLNGGEFDGHRLLQQETVRQMTRDQLPEGVGPISMFSLPLPGIQFGLGVAVVTGPVPLHAWLQPGDYFWAGVATTHFWIAPRDELIVIALTQKMPLAFDLQNVVPSLVHSALTASP